MNTAVAVPTALLSAICFGVGSVLQQQAARQASQQKSLQLRLLLDLARRPMWLTGMGLVLSSFALLGIALAFGPLILVLPLAATDLVFALPLLAWRRKMPLTRLEATGIACTAGGVSMFLTVLPPVPEGTAVPALVDWVPVLVAIGGVVALLVPIGARRQGRTSAAMYATCAAVLFALLDSLTKSVAGRLRTDGFSVFWHWELYALIVAGVMGLTLSQSAYQVGPLAVSLPIIDTVEPIGAVAIGVAVFGEQLASSTGGAAVQALGAATAVAGIVLLDRSPLARG
ncbi:DMT family transporter [Streptomyces sp. NPDC057438]|uniref:DMT family transporter n=1 Tax=Streptomyces sp. NPDC057438 TaxID=3346133 RepID=UPI003691FBC1